MPIPAVVLAVFAAASFAADKSKTQEPVVWGALSQNAGCVIFQEGHKTSGRFYGVAVTTKTIGKLTVIDSQNYTMDQQEVLETQENMDALMQRAQKRSRQIRQNPGKVLARLTEERQCYV